MILGIRYKVPEYNRVSKAIEITLVNTKAQKAPEHARLLAQQNQIGAGEKLSKPTPPKQKIPSTGQPEQVAVTKPQESIKKEAPQKMITQKSVTKQPNIVTEKVDNTNPPTPTITDKPQATLSADDLRMQIAQLGKQIMQDQQNQDETHIKSINLASTHQYLAAQYIIDWEAKVDVCSEELKAPRAIVHPNLDHLVLEVLTDGSIAKFTRNRRATIGRGDHIVRAMPG